MTLEIISDAPVLTVLSKIVVLAVVLSVPNCIMQL